MESCAFTGHRPDRYFFKYNELHPMCEKIKEALLEQVRALYGCGVRRFYTGCAPGAELWAGEAVLTLKRLSEYPGIELIGALPFEGFGGDLDAAGQNRLKELLAACTQVEIISSPGNSQATKKRNYYMVDHSGYLVAVYDIGRRLRSGTGQTVNYAKKMGKAIILIHPETAAVSYLNRE